MKLFGLSRIKKIGLAFIILNFNLVFLLMGQSAINHPLGEITDDGSETISYKGSRNYKFTERSDLRVYQNGKYVGLQSKIVSAFIIPSWTDKGLVYEGDFFVDQDTNRNKTQVALGIHDAIPSSFIINDDGNLTMLVDNGYPSFRSFPAYSSHKLKKGDVWEAKATRAVDPLSKGIVTKMPIYVQYTYTGDDLYNGEPVYLISAQWATRYNMGGTTIYVDWGGDKELSYAQGSHKATIIVSKATGAALVIRDNVDETFAYADGNKYQFKGTISLFTEYPPAIDRSKLIAALKRMELLDDDGAEKLLQRPVVKEVVKSSTISDKDDDWEPVNTSEWVSGGNPDKKDSKTKTEKLKKQIEEHQATEAAHKATPISVDNTEAGIRLTIQNLQFKADSAELLPGEEKRLDQIAEILKLADGAQFLIEGHTASTGYEAGELKLSKERADSIAAALAKRGIGSERFICKGSGGKKPIAPNDTAEGKALNRRVEITILD
ncbi:Outer membrane protein OmpA [Treponema bryantii]|uniref:Outer membrane protein OmpA n=2 Tax=Treponema bryantii TaxID=163 RepID=A0A1I3J242_9SPIR|nr:Outer membrane protein OmpA [Treponema bryantii]